MAWVAVWVRPWRERPVTGPHPAALGNGSRGFQLKQLPVLIGDDSLEGGGAGKGNSQGQTWRTVTQVRSARSHSSALGAPWTLGWRIANKASRRDSALLRGPPLPPLWSGFAMCVHGWHYIIFAKCRETQDHLRVVSRKGAGLKWSRD